MFFAATHLLFYYIEHSINVNLSFRVTQQLQMAEYRQLFQCSYVFINLSR